MLAEKIRHFLGAAFILSLILTQSLIYVAVRAVDLSTPTSLPAVFIEPLAGTSISQGRELNIRADLGGEEAGFYSAVFFTIGPANSTVQLNFEASRQTDGSWLANNAWDSSSWPIGAYQLKATANIYDNRGLLERSLVSETQSFVLTEAAPNNDVATTTVPNTNQPTSFTPSISSRLIQPTANQSIALADRSFEATLLVESSNLTLTSVWFDLYLQNAQNLDFTRIRERIVTTQSVDSGGQNYYRAQISSEGLAAGRYKLVALADGTAPNNSALYYEALTLGSSVFSLAAAVPNDTSPTVSFISPSPGQNLSGRADLSLELSRALASGHYLRAYFIASAALANLDISRYRDRAIALSRSSSTSLRYQASVELATYAAGQYSLLVYDETSASRTQLGSLALTINSSDDSSGRGYIVLLTPANGATVRENLLHLSLQTSRSYERLSLELIKANDQAQSSGEVSIPRSNGLSWIRTLTLADYLTDGLYNLMVTAVRVGGDNASSTVEEEVFALTLDRSQEEVDSSNPYLTLGTLRTSGSNNSIQGLVGLKASSNIRAQVYFVWRDSVNRQEVLRLAHLNSATTPSIDPGGSIYQYEAVLDTSRLANGNYYFSGELVREGRVIAVTSERLITVYNAENGEREDSSDNRELQIRLQKIYKKSLGDASRLVFYVISNIQSSAEPFRLLLLDESDTRLGELTFSLVSRQVAAELNLLPSGAEDNQLIYRGEITDNIYSGSSTHLISLARLDASGYIIQRSNALRLAIREGSAQAEEEIVVRNEEQESGEEENAEDGRDAEGDDGTRLPAGLSRSGLGSNFSTTCSQANIKDDNKCRAWRALIERRLDRRCQEQSIYDPVACEDYLRRLLVDSECQEQNIVDREKCKDYLLEKYSNNVECRLADLVSCSQILRDKYLNRLVLKQKDRKILAEVLNPLLGKNLSAEQLLEKLSAQGLSADTSPLQSGQNIKIFISPSREQLILEGADQLTSLGQAVLILDNDGDGLADDLEPYYQTDPENPDSDSDGYLDGVEVKNNYDPLGPGVLTKERTEFDKAVLSGQALEQPQVLPSNSSDDLSLTDVANEEDGDLRISGAGPADTWVTIYLYSDLPLVLVTRTDASGNWSYTLNKSLTDGHHQAYVTINDDTGRISTQSTPLSFLVKEAKAVAADEYFDETSAEAIPDSLLRYYILGGGLLVLLALAVIYLIHKNKNSLTT